MDKGIGEGEVPYGRRVVPPRSATLQAPRPGLEPGTYGLEGRCSIQLSYRGLRQLPPFGGHPAGLRLSQRHSLRLWPRTPKAALRTRRPGLPNPKVSQVEAAGEGRRGGEPGRPVFRLHKWGTDGCLPDGFQAGARQRRRPVTRAEQRSGWGTPERLRLPARALVRAW